MIMATHGHTDGVTSVVLEAADFQSPLKNIAPPMALNIFRVTAIDFWRNTAFVAPSVAVTGGTLDFITWNFHTKLNTQTSCPDCGKSYKGNRNLSAHKKCI